MSKEYILRVQCPDKYGIVAKVSTTLNKANLFILDSAHYGDPENKTFFMRAKLIYPKKLFNTDNFSKFFSKECKSLKMEWSIEDVDYKPNTAIFVSKYGHCLQDLMYRVDSGILPMNVSCIISNHKDHQKIASWHNIPFFHIPVIKDNKNKSEKEIRKDEGPIIDQSVERVDHAMTPKDLELIGRDLESITLARAVKYHIERRIFINNSKTVIFN